MTTPERAQLPAVPGLGRYRQVACGMLLPVQDGGHVHVLNASARFDSAPSDPPPAVLLHGFMGSAAAWPAALIKQLAEDRPVWLVDLPGHGKSDRPHDKARYALDRVLADLVDVLDVLQVERADWIGYSMGGRIALALAVSNPDRVDRLVLESASPGLETEAEREARRAADEALAVRLLDGDFEGFVDDWMALPLFAGQQRLGREWIEREHARRLTNDPVALAACLRGLGTGSQPSFWGRLGAVGAKTLVLTGQNDSKFTTIGERMGLALPRAVVEAVDGAGHAVHAERSTEWLGRVIRFLEESVQ